MPSSVDTERTTKRPSFFPPLSVARPRLPSYVAVAPPSAPRVPLALALGVVYGDIGVEL
jgi:hypothetical protein